MAEKTPVQTIAEILATHYFGIDWKNLERESQVDILQMASAAVKVYNNQQYGKPGSRYGQGNNDIG
jgi:hypothetical protein